MPKKLKKVSSIFAEKKAQAAEPAVAQPAAPVADLALSAEEEASMRERYRQFTAAKSAFADVAIQIAFLEGRKAELLSKVNDANNALVAEIRERAKARGVDPDGKAEDGKPKLTFDLETLRFAKV